MEINQILIFINSDQQDCKEFLLSVLYMNTFLILLQKAEYEGNTKLSKQVNKQKHTSSLKAQLKRNFQPEPNVLISEHFHPTAPFAKLLSYCNYLDNFSNLVWILHSDSRELGPNFVAPIVTSNSTQLVNQIPVKLISPCTK